MERRLEAAELAHERARSDLAEKDSTIRELESAASELGTARPISAEPADGSDGGGRGKSRGKGGQRSEWLAAEEGYRTEIASLKHEVHQVRIKLRHMTAKKSTREHELEETVKRLQEELSAEREKAQADAARKQEEAAAAASAAAGAEATGAAAQAVTELQQALGRVQAELEVEKERAETASKNFESTMNSMARTTRFLKGPGVGADGGACLQDEVIAQHSALEVTRPLRPFTRCQRR